MSAIQAADKRSFSFMAIAVPREERAGLSLCGIFGINHDTVRVHHHLACSIDSAGTIHSRMFLQTGRLVLGLILESLCCSGFSPEM